MIVGNRTGLIVDQNEVNNVAPRRQAGVVTDWASARPRTKRGSTHARYVEAESQDCHAAFAFRWWNERIAFNIASTTGSNDQHTNGG
jgi:hypothetical protein